jgi:hypothetical protein
MHNFICLAHLVKSLNCDALHCIIFFTSITFCPFGQSILLSSLLRRTQNSCSLHGLRDQVTHPYETEGTILIFSVLIFKVLFRDMKIEEDSELNGVSVPHI